MQNHNRQSQSFKTYSVPIWLVAILVILGLINFSILLLSPIVSQKFVAKPYKIASNSMSPTISQSDRILVNRIIYKLSSIERGDVVALNGITPQDSEIVFIKRIVGLPGGQVKVESGKVFVNGEEFIVEGAGTPNYVVKPETVPVGKFFVLGDDRSDSADSHVWGFISREKIIGRVDMIYWPANHIRMLSSKK